MDEVTGLKADWLNDQYQAFSQSLNGLSESPVNELRRVAYDRLSKTGFASTKDESWKYTNVRDLMGMPLTVAKGPVQSPEDMIAPYRFCQANGIEVVVRDGIPTTVPDSLPKGLRIRSLADIFRSGSADEVASLNEFMSSYDVSEEQAFYLLNTAFLKEGLVIDLEEAVEIEQPIHIIYVASQELENLVKTPRLILRVGAKAKLDVIEHFVGGKAQHYLMSAVSQVAVGDGARVSQYKIQEESLESSHIATVSVKQGAESNYRNLVFNFGARLARNEVQSELNGSNIMSELYGVNVLKGSQQVDNTTILDHAQPDSESNELYKAIYADKSKGAFSGTIIVREGAHGTNAIQSSQSLLVSNDATSNSRPQLKIWADDVKCTHGATIGQIDESALFYLKSRGLSDSLARRMLMTAFVGEVVSEVDIPELREYIDQRLDERLEECLPNL